EPLETTFGAGNLAEVESLLNAQPEGLSTALWDMHKRLYEKSAPWIEGYIYLASPADGPSTLTWYPVNLHPLSRGSVVSIVISTPLYRVLRCLLQHIKSSDGLEYPKIIYNFFQNPVDLYIMAAGAQRVQQIVSTPPISDYIVGKLCGAFRWPAFLIAYSPVAPVAPAAGVTSIEDLSEYIKEQAGYTNHIIGTALLGMSYRMSPLQPQLNAFP
ncbi:hypothetical protein H0H87_012560, partial [Tephrocybe sp. NHM501043]